jgi:hypothetical protein
MKHQSHTLNHLKRMSDVGGLITDGAWDCWKVAGKGPLNDTDFWVLSNAHCHYHFAQGMGEGHGPSRPNFGGGNQRPQAHCLNVGVKSLSTTRKLGRGGTITTRQTVPRIRAKTKWLSL